MSGTLSRHREAEASAADARHELDCEIRAELGSAGVNTKYLRTNHPGSFIISRNIDMFDSDKKASSDIALCPADLRNRKVITRSNHTKLIGAVQLNSLISYADPEHRKNALMDILSEAATNAADKRSVELASVGEFATVNSAMSHIFHVTHIYKTGHVKKKYDKSKNDTHHIVPIHFSSPRASIATIQVSDKIQKYVVIAFDREKDTAFMRIMDCVSDIGSYHTTDMLFVFNSLARLYADIISHKSGILPGTNIEQLNEFLFHSDDADALLASTKHSITDADTFNPSTDHCTLYYLRHMFPPNRFVNVDQAQDGNFQSRRASSYLTALMDDVGKLYYARECLQAVALTMHREVETGPTLTYAFLRENILTQIESRCSTIHTNNGIESLLLVVSKLSDYVGHLFDLICTGRSKEEKDVTLLTLKAMHRHNASMKETDIEHFTDFGHLLTVALIQTTNIEIASKYSNPILNPKIKGSAVSNEQLVVKRIKNIHSNFYAHATGYIWDTRILFIIRKKGHLHLGNVIGRVNFDSLKLFKKYTIFTEFPGYFVKCTKDPHDFEHSISLTCDIQEVISITLNAPCKTLQGSVVDHTANTL